MTAKYASGEEPQVGDVVRRTNGVSGGVRHGDVIVVTTAEDDGAGDTDINGRHHARRFTLIARAGQPVEYLPGDVVECVEWGDIKGWPVGSRFTVPVDEDWLKARFRLVHRPDAPKVEEDGKTKTQAWESEGLRVTEEICADRIARKAAEAAYADANSKPIAEIARDLRPGQKVRVTLEGVVNAFGQVIGEEASFVGQAALANATSLEIIEDAPPKPLAVGDRVVDRLTPDETCIIRHIEGDTAAIWTEAIRCLEVAPLDRLERAA